MTKGAVMSHHPFYPIVYVRGYAMTRGEIEDTVADPYMGFNLGSTKLRQRWTGDIQRHIFESPLIRLMKDYGYTDAFSEGVELSGDPPVPWKTVWVYRYYEQASRDLGDGRRPELEVFAEGLGGFLRDVRARICGADEEARREFRVYLVAHSMGGLVVRGWLQNTRAGEPDPVAVEKVFTYATPHGGIDVRLLGNVPRFVQINDSGSFNEARMREYLRIAPGEPVHSLDGKFDPGRFFSLVGTNERDYTAAHGLSRLAVGPMSDGLVRIRNAYVKGGPRAFVHRAHSGHFGIVNSEEGYQNLRRFFFGDMAVYGVLHVRDFRLPPKIETAKRKGRPVRASYHVEVIVRVRDFRWDLHRRTLDEGSAVFAKYDEVVEQGRGLTLFSTFLSRALIQKNSRYMGLSVDLRVLVPEYVVGDDHFFDDHYDGAYLFRDKLNLLVDRDADGAARVKYGWDNENGANRAGRVAGTVARDGGWQCEIPVRNTARPGIDAVLTLRMANMTGPGTDPGLGTDLKSVP
ncbi:MAG: hypothetical protein IT489_05255 [Gammaproteobacteria bacterium]|nr:hypothetical protein [Gammaproteobacteria bacterium]